MTITPDAMSKVQLAESNLIDVLSGLATRNKDEFSQKIRIYPAQVPIKRAAMIKGIMEYLTPPELSRYMLIYFEKFDRYLIASGKRDHFVHQFESYLLGLNIIELIASNSDISNTFKFTEIKDIRTTWLLTAIGHDLGYPFEAAGSLLKKLADLYEGYGLLNIQQFFTQLNIRPDFYREYETCFVPLSATDDNFISKRLDINAQLLHILKHDLGITEEEAKSLQTQLLGSNEKSSPITANHGYVSALILCRTIFHGFLSQSHETPESFALSTMKKILFLAAGAIAVHSLDDLVDNGSYFRKKISFEKNPMAFVLYIVDNLQDWNRLDLEDKNYPEFHLFNFEKHLKKIDIHFLLHHEEWTDQLKASQKTFLEDKQKTLTKAQPPSPTVGTSIVVKYFICSDELNPFFEFTLTI